MGDVSKNFSRKEFACKCGCGFDTVDHRLIHFLEMIRERFGAPVTVNSGCRCSTYNMKVGGSLNSQHKLGRAADIVVDGVPPDAVADYAESIGAPGVGRYATFTHIDSRNTVSRWRG